MRAELSFIRHGAAASNLERRYLGKSEEGLCAQGVQALREDKAAGRYETARLVFASPMARCLETARILYPGQEPILVPEWTEIDFGAFEGKNHGELSADPRYQAWLDSNGELPFPGGEGREAFIRRCRAGYEKMERILMRHIRDARENAAAVVHGGTIMALLSHYCGGEYFSYQTGNGGGYVCVAEIGKTRLEVRRKL